MVYPIKEPPQALLDSLFEKEPKNPIQQDVQEAYEWGMVCFDTVTESVKFDLGRVTFKIAVDSAEIELEMSTLKIKNPIIFKPIIKFNPYKICVEIPGLNINAGDIEVDTRAELISKLRDQLKRMWNEYAIEPDENLTFKALELKKNLLSTFEELPSQFKLFGSDPNCDHETTSAPGGGCKCKKCDGWFCY